MTDINGYITPGYTGIKAQLKDRYIELVYRADISEPCNLTVYLRTNGNIGDFQDSTVTLKQNNNIIDSKVINNGVASFPGLPIKTSYTIELGSPTINVTYELPSPKTIITQFNDQNVILEVYTENTGLWLVKNDWTEVELSAELINSGELDGKKDEYLALHVNPKILRESGNDYYVRLLDLTNERTITTKNWQSNDTTLPNVSNDATTEYRGKLMTYYMRLDCTTLGVISPAANYVVTQTLTLANNRVLSGFMGTVAQMRFLYPLNYPTNKTLIYDALTSLGYTPDYASTATWSSSQNGARNCWCWTGSSWSGSTTYYWYKYYGYSYLVLPLFSLN